MTASTLFCVVYRTGGTENFQWHRSLAMPRVEAEAARLETERMGYRALIERYDRSTAIGLPETYQAGAAGDWLAASPAERAAILATFRPAGQE